MSSSGDERTKSTIIEGGDRSPHRRLVALWDGGVADFALPKKGSLDVGRSQTCQLRIDHGSVSRRHIVWHAGDPDVIEDCGSSNGTRLNGRRVPAGSRVEVRPGDGVQIGRVLLLIQGEREPAKATPLEGAMERVLRLVDLAAPTDLTVLLLGETGVGKDVLAERIHRSSPRAQGPLLRLNCAAFRDALLESELFGHEKGAFTGATQAKPGLLEAAHGGTVLLDEIGEMDPAVQAKLLLVLERREVLRVGSVKPRAVDIRFVAATNRDLLTLASEGAFRNDLLHRLNGITIRIPPLRERREEIEPLAREMVLAACRAAGKTPPVLTEDAVRLLGKQSYPGNIRELKNLVERAVAFAAGGAIDGPIVELALATSAGAEPVTSRKAAPSVGLRPEVEALERQRIFEALERVGGNQTKAAALLGMPRRTLVSKLARYGVTRPRESK